MLVVFIHAWTTSRGIHTALDLTKAIPRLFLLFLKAKLVGITATRPRAHHAASVCAILAGYGVGISEGTVGVGVPWGTDAFVGDKALVHVK